MAPPLKLALFGAGNIGARHLSLAAAAADCLVTAVADPADAARTLAHAHGARFYRDADALLETEATIDGAIVATPNDQHLAVGLACIRRGVPVLMEKPITDTLSAGEELVTAAKERSVPLAVGHHRRFDPAIEAAREILAGGGIGKLLAIECLWAMRKHGTYYDAPWRRQRPSGGPALINLIHDVDLLRYLCGSVIRLNAEGGAIARDHEVEDTLAVSLRFASGAVGTILVSDAAPSPWGWELGTGENPEIPPTGRNCYRFMGSEGALALPRLEHWRHSEDGPANWHHPIHMRTIAAGTRAALEHQLKHFCGVVRGEHSPRVSGEDGLRTLRTVLAIQDSLTGGGPITLEQ
ncbi:MAG: gfo/Idh/MocA family oxidoreductase [Gammaproteobacteria bacterium]|nr:gfo/Idh/MocA family oxidoreductase [Gammaproteobacteria bacterium]